MLYILLAEREAQTALKMGRGTLEELAEIIEAAEEEGSWPEGFDAVARPVGGGAPFVYADDWEEF